MSRPMRDPAKALRGIMAGTLIMEAIVVALALLVVAKLGGGVASLGGVLIGALAVAMLVASGFMRFPWGFWVAVALQLAMIATGVVVFALGVLGVVFALVWAYLWWLRRELTRSQASIASN